jgi:hypothetical protein
MMQDRATQDAQASDAEKAELQHLHHAAGAGEGALGLAVGVLRRGCGVLR